jgi:hypothetical protein
LLGEAEQKSRAKKIIKSEAEGRAQDEAAAGRPQPPPAPAPAAAALRESLPHDVVELTSSKM